MTNLGAIPFLPSSHLSGRIDPRPAEIIVMHSMECPAEAGRATNWAKSLASPTGSKSFAHYQTDPRTVVQSAELGRTCPHVGNGNRVRGRWTLGIEQAGYAAFSRQQWINSGALNTSKPLVEALIAAGHGAARWLSPADLKVPGVRGVTSHNNMRIAFGGTTHTDPGDNYPHDLLLATVAAPVTAAPPPPPRTEYEDMVILASTGSNPVPNAIPNAYYACVGLEKSLLSPAALASWKALFNLDPTVGKDIGHNDARVALSPQNVANTKMPGDA